MPLKISAILSVFNGENYLAEAISSLLAQEYPLFEVIVVDDGSTDQTPAIIRSFGDAIRSIRKSNRGLGAARNTGVYAAKGDYFTFLDHDDLWSSDKIRMQASAITKDDPILFSSVQQFICPSLSQDERKKLIVDEQILPGYLAGTMLISKKRFFEVGYFRENNEVGDFVDWFLRAKEADLPMQILPHLGLLRRVHRENMGRRPDLYSRSAYLRILHDSLKRRRAQPRECLHT